MLIVTVVLFITVFITVFRMRLTGLMGFMGTMRWMTQSPDTCTTLDSCLLK